MNNFVDAQREEEELKEYMKNGNGPLKNEYQETFNRLERYRREVIKLIK